MLSRNTNVLRVFGQSLLHSKRTIFSTIVSQQQADVKAETPLDLAKSSSIETKAAPLTARQIPKYKRPLLSGEKEETAGFQLPKWKEYIGEKVISVLHLDMDRVRSGPVAGSKYYALCKLQGLQYPDEQLSETAKFYYETLGLPRTFSQWFQITALHQWLLFVRMRALPLKYGKEYQQKLIDRFFRDMELRLSEEMNVNSNRIIETYLKDFNAQMRGLVLSYDEGLVGDDVTLAAALWRNLFNGKTDVDYTHLEAMVGYVRMQLYVLSKITDREFGFGDFEFVKPNEVVTPLTAKQESDLKKAARAKYAPEGVDLPPNMKSVLSLDE